MKTTAKGSAGELFVAKELEGKDFIVASRRHVGGAGDLLAVHVSGSVWLVEVKALANGRSPYEGFTRSKRQEMLDTPLPLEGSRWLATVRGSGKNRRIEWCHESSWPPSSTT